MLIALCSLSGAPGVSTLALALAATWPGTQSPVLVEADASGGDIGVWHRVPGEPGLVGLAAGARSAEPGTASAGLADGHAQDLPGGVRVVCAPAAPHLCEPSVRLLAARSEALRAGAGVVVLDVGRMVPGSAGAALAARTDAVLVCTTAEPAQLRRVAACAEVLAALPGRGARVGLAVIGSGFADAEIAEQTGLEVWARIPHDRRGADFVAGRAGGAGIARRPLLRTARRLAGRITREYEEHQAALRALVAEEAQ
ncbi:hypothetical protein CLV63_11251 [Murinocardiopsis flavida]|uniref:MinD-like ATPase involved in chromosome partitioning or flagellar assembly n=1 Tax=Murinocardiopsis flavida TaxID=645275 RepID=A0A2P8DG40_9ACTN|nr:hypothetical protein [Murinocardiopsis flavida]PSK96169.1 hypothetical protein CLV63_11251 [Murinocardiopsis flavida]